MTSDPIVTVLSSFEYCFTAEMMPSVIPIRASRMLAKIVSCRV